MKGQKVKIPYQINQDSGLSYTARRVYCALRYFRMLCARRGGKLLKTYSEIGAAANIKDEKTVARAVAELQAAGYLEVKEHFYWEADRQLVRRGTNEYTLQPVMGEERCYVWVPVKLLAAPISPAAFAVLLFLLRKQGANDRCWPSLRRGFQQICQRNGKPMPRKTICAALEQLKNCMMLLVLHCEKKRYGHGRKLPVYFMNSYMLTVWGDWTAEQAAPENNDHSNTPAPAGRKVRGGYFFGGLPVRTKITLGLDLEEKIIGVDQFGKIDKEWVDISGFSPHDMGGLSAIMSMLGELYGGSIPFSSG